MKADELIDKIKKIQAERIWVGLKETDIEVVHSDYFTGGELSIVDVVEKDDKIYLMTDNNGT